MRKDKLVNSGEWGHLRPFMKKMVSRMQRRHIKKVDKRDIRILVKFK